MWFRRKQKPDPAEAARGLREQALTVSPADIGLGEAGTRGRVWGVLMETGYPQAVATLVTLADGTTSLYFSNGGGILGAGGHAEVRQAGTELLAVAEAHRERFVRASETPLPPVGRVRFYLHTDDGVLTAEATEQDLGHGRHPLAPVFHAGHAVIAAVREATERQRRG
jgi:hypothetical protein